MVVDEQWTQLRKYRAARSLSPLRGLCGSEGSLTHRHAHYESFTSRALPPALKVLPPGHAVLCETRWQRDRSLLTGVVFGGGSAHEGQDADLCVAVWG